VELAFAVPEKVMLADIEARAAAQQLVVLGGFAAEPDDELPRGTKTLLLLGPMEPGFWPHLQAQPEWGDYLQGVADPVDRWSRRVIGRMACNLGAKALFPFGGPPWHPFYKWALKTGRCWDSPVRLLVHDAAGLFVSFRGALALKQAVASPPAPQRPCDTCVAKPCLTACPVGALTSAGYNLPSCHAYLDTKTGQACLTGGCAVRRACPVSLGYARMPEQSAYHMGQFHK
jgi:epoxyqueuosine reductase